MASLFGRIERIPLESRTKLKASIHISSLTDVVLGLVKNSLDAQADAVDIQVDLIKGCCSVLDNGRGISKYEFLETGGLAKMHHSSKNKQPIVYSRSGCFLAELSSMSLVRISSCESRSAHVNSLLLVNGGRIGSAVDLDSYEELGPSRHGTKVAVYNLFGKTPVRQKYHQTKFQKTAELRKAWLILRKELVAIILSTARDIRVDMIESNSTQHLRYRPASDINHAKLPGSDHFSTQRTISALTQSGLFGEQDEADWHAISAETGVVSIQAAFSLRPAPTKTAQFISIGHIPLKDVDSDIYKSINTIFDRSTFGTVDDGPVIDTDKTDAQVPLRPQSREADSVNVRTRKCVDKWPVFFILISKPILDDNWMLKNLNEPSIHDPMIVIANAVKMLVREFLNTYGYTINKPNTYTRKIQHTNTDNIRSELNGFEQWSRIKSSSLSVQSRLTEGLPFNDHSNTKHQKLHGVKPKSFIEDIDSTEEASDAGVEWTNLSTGQRFTLDPKTGMAWSAHQKHRQLKSKSMVSRLKKPPGLSRNVTETARLLDEKLLAPKPYFAEIPIPSLVQYATNLQSQEQSFQRFTSNLQIQLGQPTDHRYPCIDSVSRNSLKYCRVIGQADDKFILVALPSQDLVDGGTTLLLVDQHAADERIKVEELFANFCSGKQQILPMALTFELDVGEAEVVAEATTYLSSWGIQFTLEQGSGGNKAIIRISALPELIAERCRLQPSILINLIRSEAWLMRDPLIAPKKSLQDYQNDWVGQIVHCPRGVSELLISRACRSAVMFNDKLTNVQAQALMHGLTKCVLPFKCAHGRPSMTTLTRIMRLEESKNDEITFGEAWRAWNSKI